MLWGLKHHLESNISTNEEARHYLLRYSDRGLCLSDAVRDEKRP